MKIIKFRGKTVSKQEWVYGFYLMNDFGEPTICGLNEAGKFLVEKVIAETVGSFTGLEDRTGKEIYEGDIVRFTRKIGYGWGNDKGDICQVNWFESGSYVGWGFREQVPLTKNKANFIEIIGNIHENPELIK